MRSNGSHVTEFVPGALPRGNASDQPGPRAQNGEQRGTKSPEKLPFCATFWHVRTPHHSIPNSPLLYPFSITPLRSPPPLTTRPITHSLLTSTPPTIHTSLHTSTPPPSYHTSPPQSKHHPNIRIFLPRSISLPKSLTPSGPTTALLSSGRTPYRAAMLASSRPPRLCPLAYDPELGRGGGGKKA